MVTEVPLYLYFFQGITEYNEETGDRIGNTARIYQYLPGMHIHVIRAGRGREGWREGGREGRKHRGKNEEREGGRERERRNHRRRKGVEKAL